MGFTSVNQRDEDYRKQIRRIIDSEEFHGRTRLVEFLIYASEARLQGRTRLDQSEIADRILHRGPDFNPLDDASVRKTATLVRQRLERYYTGTGADDRIVVSLPIRSYILQFRELGSAEDTEQHSEDVAFAGKRSERWNRYYPSSFVSNRYVLALAACLAASAAIATAWWWARQPASIVHQVWNMVTVRGDFMHTDLDLPSNAILVGPRIGDTDDITVRMQFSPEHAVQQAGLLVFENADRYVKLGRQFLSRPAMEFGLETQARYQKPPNTFLYDPNAQDGDPVWLSIRRNGATFNAFASATGSDWHALGNTLAMPDPLTNPRVAIFADHGRTNAPATTARFDHLSVGMEFHDLPTGPTDLSQFSGWHLTTNCPTGPGTSFSNDGLRVRLGAGTGACSTQFTTPIPKDDWAIATKLDFLPSNSALAGLMVLGSKGMFRTIRWDLNGGAITAEFVGHGQGNLRDFEGSPAVVLRIDLKNGILYPSLSRDNLHFEQLPLSIPLDSLGDHIEYGILVARSTWFAQRDTPEARFEYVRRPVLRLSNFR